MRHHHPGHYPSRTPRGRIVFKRRPLHNITLPKHERKIFQQLDKEKFEVGGNMDFNQRGLERATVQIGNEGAVDLDISPDYESNYHTHPTKGNKQLDKLNYFPSKDDILSADLMPSQTMIIFHDGNATVAKKTDSFKPDNKIINEIEKGLVKDAPNMKLKELFKKYSPKYKKMGMEIKLEDKKGSIDLPARVVEPVDKVRQGMFFGKKPSNEAGDRNVIPPVPHLQKYENMKKLGIAYISEYGEPVLEEEIE